MYFEEDSGVEYVYKEPKVTTLSEISERIHKQFTDKFGVDVVKMIMDSIPVSNIDYHSHLEISNCPSKCLLLLCKQR